MMMFCRRHGVFHADMNVDDMELATLKQAVATAASYATPGTDVPTTTSTATYYDLYH